MENVWRSTVCEKRKNEKCAHESCCKPHFCSNPDVPSRTANHYQRRSLFREHIGCCAPKVLPVHHAMDDWGRIQKGRKGAYSYCRYFTHCLLAGNTGVQAVVLIPLQNNGNGVSDCASDFG